MNTAIHRRRFLQTAALATGGIWLAGCQTPAPRRLSANEKLNIGVIGVSGRGAANLQGVSSENIVALCDVDERALNAAGQKFPKAKRYHDFRKLLEQSDLDAVVVSTPDHTHAVATAAALRSGRHVYCEKPLTHTVSECRVVTRLAERSGLATQIGTQIHAGRNYRRVVELVQTGAIGPVAEVHVWSSARYGGLKWPTEFPPVPEYLHYDLWLGPVPYVPYSPEWVPFKWRNWWAFGNGSLGDFGCHFMDLPFWALGLRFPVTVEVLDGPPVDEHSTPPWLIVRYEFPAREKQPPVRLTWYHGAKKPEMLESLRTENQPYWNSGVLFVGSKGYIISDYSNHVLLPEEKFKDFKRPEPFIPDSMGHHAEWIMACKTGMPTTCHFGYSGPLTETVLLGNVAYRAESRLEWDARLLRAKNCQRADSYIHHQYRPGWKL